MQPDKHSMERLDAAAKYIFNHRYNQLGYPFDQESGMNDFYGWVERNGLGAVPNSESEIRAIAGKGR